MTEHWVQIYSNKRRLSTSHNPILEPVFKPARQATQFTPILSPLPSLTFYGPHLPPPLPNFGSFCVTRISSPKRCKKIECVVLNRACIKGFFVLNWVRFQTSAADLYPNIGRVLPPPPIFRPFWKPRSPWEEEEPLELERSRDCGMLVHRRQRNNNWTRQKNRESFVFTIRKVVSPFPVLNTPENLTDFLRNALL